jgi:hypothetical protein
MKIREMRRKCFIGLSKIRKRVCLRENDIKNHAEGIQKIFKIEYSRLELLKYGNNFET